MKVTLPYRFIVTSGPTREWIDPVRYLSNPSTGSMGWHLAHAAQACYEETIYISGPGEKDYREVEGSQNIFVENTQEMHDAVHSFIGDYSVLVMAAAPADYYCKNILTQKMKKQAGQAIQLELLPTVDILKSLIPVAKSYKHFYRIGFAAETQNLIENASQKLKAKELFLVCVNQVYRAERGFGDHHSTLQVLDQKNNIQSLGPSSKAELALSLLNILSCGLPSYKALESVSQETRP